MTSFLRSYGNRPISPAYGVYISKLIWYARACHAFEKFLKQGQLLTKTLMLQGNSKWPLKSFSIKVNINLCDLDL